jgi:hypothetical protein
VASVHGLFSSLRALTLARTLPERPSAPQHKCNPRGPLDGAPAPTRTSADAALVQVLARAFRYQRLLDEGRYACIGEMAKTEKIERGYLGTLLRLTLLAPDIVEAHLDGR